MDVPEQVDGPGRWSLDHLFLDQDGIPTFVECKRASDTRARREVVAQMLDYAANGAAYWSADRLRAAAEQTHRGVDALNGALIDLLALYTPIDGPMTARTDAPSDDPVDPPADDPADNALAPALDAYWRRVADNLAAGRVRLVFVADELPKELRRLIEFLNGKMADVEVLGVEVRQFLSGEAGRSVLVPRVIGITEEARDRKPATTPSASRGPLLDWPTFSAQCTPSVAAFFERVQADAAEAGDTIAWQPTCFTVRVPDPDTGRLRTIAYAYPNYYGSPPPCLEIYLSYLKSSPDDFAAIRSLITADNAFILAPTGKWSFRGLLHDADVGKIESAWRRFRGRVGEMDARHGVE